LEFLGELWNILWQTLFNVLVVINSVIHVPALAIIIFTVLVRLLVVPLTMKSLRSNRNMQQIQPLLKEVQRKYKDDRAKQQEEQMKLYQQYGINPAAGCFPMLVQLPIFFALYSALNFVLHLHFDPTAAQHAADMAQLQSILWVKDWAQYANFSAPFLWVPNLGAADPLYIWPVLSALFQFFQNRMALPRRDPNQPMDSQQKMMNGMMQFMPLYILFISINFPAGNVIYWAFSSLFGAVQQYFITGFGTLPDFPGFGWLPRKEITPPPLPPPPPAGQVAKKGLFSNMMSRALEAQEAQKATKEQPQLQQGSSEEGQPTRALSNSTKPERPRDGATTTRVKSKASEQHIHVVSTNTVKYASDIRNRGNGSGGNGYTSTNGKGAQLPGKKRNKR
jgi:YidC/Oxa1 family membrane protein insertase